jgi:hypothetical protein
MNPAERFLACMRFQSFDRPPYLEWWGPWESTLRNWIHETGLPRDKLLAYRDEMDAVVETDLDFAFLPAFQPALLSRDDQYDVLRDRMGLTYRVFAQDPETSMPEFLSFPVHSAADWNALKQRLDPTLPERYPSDWLTQVAAWQRDRPIVRLCGHSGSLYWGLSLFGFCRIMLGDEEVLYAFYDQPALIHDMLGTITEFNIAVIRRALREAPICWVQIWEDMCFNGGPLISPAMFRTFLLPLYRRMADAIHEAGVDLIMVDSDGDVAQLAPLWLEAGISGVYPMEQAAGNDLFTYRARYGRNLLMYGGIDKRVLTEGHAAIERELRNKIPLAWEGGYIPTLDHTIPSDVTYANYMYYLSLKRKLLEM